jgi:[acyl-carrier-protein] S-malonyltransferase
MKRAFIFPGQASQFVGMGKDLYEQFDPAKKYFNLANEILDRDLKQICFEGPEEELKQTYNTQPAIFVHSVIVFTLLKDKNILPEGVAGHSLGEYSALVAAGSLSFEDGLRLVKIRSELMYRAGKEKPGTMAALIGLTPEQVYELCENLKGDGIIQPANFNSPGQIAISGEVDVIIKAIEAAKDMGARKAVELVVSGAFHSPLMESAQEGLKDALEQTTFKDANVPLYPNVSANPIQNKNQIRDMLYEQLSKPVLWQKSMENMIKDGYNKFYEIGPGKVLKGLLKRIDRSVPCIEIGTIHNLENIGETA